MLKKHEVTDPASCLNKADENEPVFVLRANDEVAPSIVEEWAMRYALQKHLDGGEMTPQQLRKYHEAMNLAKAMREWKKARTY